MFSSNRRSCFRFVALCATALAMLPTAGSGLGKFGQNGAGSAIRLVIPRYNLDDSAIEIHRTLNLDIVVESYSRPRQNVTVANRTGRPAVFSGTPEQIVSAVAATFQYQRAQHRGIALLTNRLGEQDELYRVPDEVTEHIQKHPPNGTFQSLCNLQSLSPLQISSLTEQYPVCGMLSASSTRRKQIELYAVLPDKVRQDMDKGKSVKVSSLPPSVRRQTVARLATVFPQSKTSSLNGTVLQLRKDATGWQFLAAVRSGQK